MDDRLRSDRNASADASNGGANDVIHLQVMRPRLVPLDNFDQKRKRIERTDMDIAMDKEPPFYDCLGFSI